MRTPSATVRKRSGESGMTLLEVQVAVILLALISLVMMGALGAQQRHVTSTEAAARLSGVVRLDARRVVVTRLESNRGAAACVVRPVAVDQTRTPAVVTVQVLAP